MWIQWRMTTKTHSAIYWTSMPLYKPKPSRYDRKLWFSNDIAQAKRVRRQYERTWRRTRLQPDLDIFKDKRKAVCHLLDCSNRTITTKKTQNVNKMEDFSTRAWIAYLSAVRSHLCLLQRTLLSFHKDSFCEYFSTKI